MGDCKSWRGSLGSWLGERGMVRDTDTKSQTVSHQGWESPDLVYKAKR